MIPPQIPHELFMKSQLKQKRNRLFRELWRHRQHYITGTSVDFRFLVNINKPMISYSGLNLHAGKRAVAQYYSDLERDRLYK